MRWQGGRRSANVEDRRRVGRPAVVGGGLSTLILLLVFLWLGVDPTPLLEGMDAVRVDTSGYDAPGPASSPEDPLADFVSVVLADTEDVWTTAFREMEQRYHEPTLVLFTGEVRSACGFAQAAMGPFYCPADRKVYIDLAFYRELRDRFHAPGDFAQAYVIAHEVGHHVQNLLGISGEVRAARARMSERQANAVSVKLELQADCLAGVWGHRAHRARNILETGDVEEALRAATAIGDDRLQRDATGTVRPDSFTHGTSAQRVHWFRRGLESGDPDACDTFS
jgi:predicted metalloprotease